ncbi:MAG: hypothetical protein ABFS21_01720 [Actinomycetota bacterium]
MLSRVLAIAALFVVGLAAPAVAQADGECATRFPEVEWVRLDTPVDVYAAGVPEGHATRYEGEITGAVEQINGHFGEFDATVCLFDPESGFDQSRFVSGSRRLHSLLLADDGVLVVSTARVGLTGSAVAFGLGHVAMWQYSQGAGFPEPQASTIAQYYRSEVRDRAMFDHAEAKASNFFGPEVVTPWSAGMQADPMFWDPSSGITARTSGPGGPTASAATPASTHMADLIRFGITHDGESFITDPDPVVWADLEARWRHSLTAEIMGTDQPTTAWRSGLAIAIGIVLGAAIAVALGFISKRRARHRPETPDPIPGFFESQ